MPAVEPQMADGHLLTAVAGGGIGKLTRGVPSAQGFIFVFRRSTRTAFFFAIWLSTNPWGWIAGLLGVLLLASVFRCQQAGMMATSMSCPPIRVLRSPFVRSLFRQRSVKAAQSATRTPGRNLPSDPNNTARFFGLYVSDPRLPSRSDGQVAAIWPKRLSRLTCTASLTVRCG